MIARPDSPMRRTPIPARRDWNREFLILHVSLVVLGDGVPLIQQFVDLLRVTGPPAEDVIHIGCSLSHLNDILIR